MTDAPKVYCYHSVTGEFTEMIDARLSPAWTDKDQPEGQWLLPAWATTDEVPLPGEKQAAVYANGAWSLVEDHRGETYYDGDGKQVTITGLGPVDPTFTTEPPETPEEQQQSPDETREV